MTTFARPTPASGRPRPRRAAALTGALACVLAGLALAAPAAEAVVTTVGGTTVGFQPRNKLTLYDGLEKLQEGETSEFTAPRTFANPAGNPVVHGSNVFLVYWDPTGSRYHGDWQRVIDHFVANAAASSESGASVFANDTQYTDKSNQPAFAHMVYRGAYTDTDPYPSEACVDPHPLEKNKVFNMGPLTCLDDEQIRTELAAFISSRGLPTGMHSIFYVLLPPGATVCLDAGGVGGHCSDFTAPKNETEESEFKGASYEHSFCSYHGDVNPTSAPAGDGSTILYGVVPWTAGGWGDGQFALGQRKLANACQDGGFNAAEGFAKNTRQEEPNFGACPSGDGFCDTGLADLIVNQVATEQQNIVTNPLLSSWKDELGNEVTDECRNFFAPILGGSPSPNPQSEVGTMYNQLLNGGQYYLNDSFDLAAVKLSYPGVFCVPGLVLDPAFTAPSPVNAGEVVGFNGMESRISLNAGTTYNAEGAPQTSYATFSWNFGDGTAPVTGYAPGAPTCSTPWLSPCAASVYHAFQYGGTYTVTLTVTDVGGNTANVSRTVTVAGPPPPGSSGSGSGGGAGGGSGSGSGAGSSAGTSGSSGSGSSGGGASPAPVVPPPVLADAVVSRSLRTLGRSGLVVRYSVNEQVAGHFEVLLARAVAQRLGISGPAAAGLPPGSAPQVVIAKAILVTTAGGRSTVSIQLSKRTAARLARLRKATLMLRVVVRNAAHTPTTTTTLSSFTLGR